MFTYHDIIEPVAEGQSRYSKDTVIEGYNTLGQITRKSDTTYEGDKVTVRQSLSDIVYDAKSRIITTQESISESGTNENGALNKTTKALTNITYDTYGRLNDTVVTTWGKKPGTDAWQETSHIVTSNTAYASDGKASEITTREYSALDENNERFIINTSVSKNRVYGVYGKLTFETVVNTAFDGTLLDVQDVSYLAFNDYGQATQTRIESYRDETRSADARLLTQDITVVYDSLLRQVSENKEIDLYSFGKRKTVTEYSGFDANGQITGVTVKDYADNGTGWEFESASRKTRVFDDHATC